MPVTKTGYPFHFNKILTMVRLYVILIINKSALFMMSNDETGLYYLKSRYYDPKVGRFITIDDISYIDHEKINGLNFYAYCGNNPVMRIDENGATHGMV